MVVATSCMPEPVLNQAEANKNRHRSINGRTCYIDIIDGSTCPFGDYDKCNEYCVAAAIYGTGATMFGSDFASCYGHCDACCEKGESESHE